jgi:hypothetical protein
MDMRTMMTQALATALLPTMEGLNKRMHGVLSKQTNSWLILRVDGFDRCDLTCTVDMWATWDYLGVEVNWVNRPPFVGQGDLTEWSDPASVLERLLAEAGVP